MLIPGFAVLRAPMIVRLFLALSLSMAMYPLLRVLWKQGVLVDDFVRILFVEVAVGLFFGFLCAIFSHAIKFAATFIMALIGLAGIPGQPIDDLEPNPPFVMLLSMVFTALVFATDLHLACLLALIETYHVYPLGMLPNPATAFETILNSLRDTSLLVLQASSPFILHSLGINFALGLVGKLTPQLQVYFALMGVSTLIALLVLYLMSAPTFMLFLDSYAFWLENGL